MIQINKNIQYYDDDKEVLQIIAQLKSSGLKFPNPPIGDKPFTVPIVGFQERKFSLMLFSYHNMEGDSGFTLVHIRDFLNETRVNLLEISKALKIDVVPLLGNIIVQAQDIAKKVEYPYTISSIITEKFIGVIATLNHPIDELLNTSGKKN